MKKMKSLIIIVLLLITQLNLSAQDMKNYKKRWTKVQEYESVSLPKSALKEVDTILQKADEANNIPQYVKALIHKTKYLLTWEDADFNKNVYKIDSIAQKSTGLKAAVLHFMTAKMYRMYFTKLYYKIYQRTSLQTQPDDIETWTLDDFVKNIQKEYKLCLSQADILKKTPVDEFEVLINKGDVPKKLRPTLYDFLVHQIIDFYKNPEMQLTKPSNEFALREKYYFTDIQNFVKQKINLEDSLSMKFKTIKLYQDLLKFRLADKQNLDALIFANLERLEYVSKNSVYPNKEAEYLNALKKLTIEYAQNPYIAIAYYYIAQYYTQRATKYSAENPITKEYKNDYVKAMDICRSTIKKYPKNQGSELCKQLIANLSTKSLSFQTEQIIPTNDRFALKISYKNTKKIFYRIAKINFSDYQKINNKKYDKKRYKALIQKAIMLSQSSKELPDDKDYRTNSIELLMDGLPKGFYLIFVANNEKFNYKEALASYSALKISDLTFVSQQKSGNSFIVYCSNRKTGQALTKAQITAFSNEYNYKKSKYVRKNIKTLTSNAKGWAEFTFDKNRNESIYFEVKYQDEKLKSESYYYALQDYIQTSLVDYFFTDRAIYRPGQTVYFKGIRIQSYKNNPKKVSGKKVEVQLLDVNYQEQGKLELTTNEYGTFSGEFKLPKGVLNGNFQLKTAQGSISFSVEEYKRPKFAVRILPFKGNYRLNQEVEIKGEAKSYARVAISDADVKYRITREPLWSWWWWNPPQAPTEIANGKLKTDDNGHFKLNFKALSDPSYSENEYLSFNYSISIDVTDINGETHSTTSNIRIGYRDLKLSTNITKEMDLAQIEPEDSFLISSTNLNGESINAKGKIIISKLKEPKTILRTRYWQAGNKHLYTPEEWAKLFPGNSYGKEEDLKYRKIDKKVAEISFDTQKLRKIALSEIKKLSTGNYILEIQSKDAFGKQVTAKQFLSLVNSEDKKMPFPIAFKILSLKSEGQPGDSAKFLLGTSYKDAIILVSYEHKGKITKYENISLNNELKSLKIPITEEDRGNFSIHFVLIYNNRFYTQDEVVLVPYDNKKLDIEFQTFRDKLQPGEQEEWRIKIKDKDGKNVSAEMLATLYDASLDQFRLHDWLLNIYHTYYTQRNWKAGYYGAQSSNNYTENLNQIYYVKVPVFNSFNWFGLAYNLGYDYFTHSEGVEEVVMTKARGRKHFKKMAKPQMGKKRNALISEDEESQEMPVPTSDKVVSSNVSPPPETPDFTDVKVRSNFNETAFFYPHLQTDADGNIIVKFTIPESLTKWKAMTFATTKDLKYGFQNKTLITQKKLMLNPNPPRFYRQGDKMIFPVKISNISDKNLSGHIQLEFFDAISDKKVNIFTSGEKGLKNFKLIAGKNSLETWEIQIPDNVDALMYKVVAKAGNFSDGEQKLLPVLSNRMLLTESMPLNIRGNQTKTFRFDKLLASSKSKSIVNKRLTLEFTSNPAWYAVQALPYMMEYPYECSEQTFNRFYSNSIATHIANSNPQIKAVFDSWANIPDSKALLSNLEKNQELKSVLLEETPWVLDGKDETERKKRIAVLFDLSHMAKEQALALKKLQKAQSPNGGFPWFKGMPESWYITQYIISGMGHLKHLQVAGFKSDNKTNKFLSKGINFIDLEFTNYYRNLKKFTKAKDLKKDHLSYIAIQYMYARSFFRDRKMDNDTKEAFDYFLRQAQQYWTGQNNYMRGMLALILHRYEKQETALKIIASLKEHSIQNNEMGMFWKNKGGWFWYQAPIETQALLIEAFSEVAQDNLSVEEMKIWLLKQKQTQDWKTTRATAEAIYALLLQGTNILASKEQVEIFVGGQKIEPDKLPDTKMEAGTGYFKTAWTGKDIKPEMGEVKLTNKDNGIAWGALYWQYFENLDKITPHETPLKLTKELFIEKQTQRGKVLTKISVQNALKVGDKIIVRIELRVDRNMEFVHMKDMRAAGLEPVNIISQYKYQDGLGYYEETKDASTNFFFDYLRKGTYVFEYPLRVALKGEYSNGISLIQCMYAPEFTAHSQGKRIEINN